MQPPLIVISDVFLLSTSDGIMMLHNTQSVVKLEAVIINFLNLFLSSGLVNLQSGKDVLLRIKESRSVLCLLFEARSRRIVASPERAIVQQWEYVIFLYGPFDIFFLKSIRESAWSRHDESHINLLDFVTYVD